MCVLFYVYVFFFKQKTAYEMRISDWSSDVCSSDLKAALLDLRRRNRQPSPNFSLWATAKLPAGPLSRLRREPRFFPSALTAHSLKDRPALRYLAVSRREDWILMVP